MASTLVLEDTDTGQSIGSSRREYLLFWERKEKRIGSLEEDDSGFESCYRGLVEQLSQFSSVCLMRKGVRHDAIGSAERMKWHIRRKAYFAGLDKYRSKSFGFMEGKVKSSSKQHDVARGHSSGHLREQR